MINRFLINLSIFFINHLIHVINHKFTYHYLNIKKNGVKNSMSFQIHGQKGLPKRALWLGMVKCLILPCCSLK